MRRRVCFGCRCTSAKRRKQPFAQSILGQMRGNNVWNNEKITRKNSNNNRQPAQVREEKKSNNNNVISLKCGVKSIRDAYVYILYIHISISFGYLCYTSSFYCYCTNVIIKNTERKHYWDNGRKKANETRKRETERDTKEARRKKRKMKNERRERERRKKQTLITTEFITVCFRVNWNAWNEFLHANVCTTITRIHKAMTTIKATTK